jgi:transcription factor SPN1
MSESDLSSQPPTPVPEAGHTVGNGDRSMSEEQDSPPVAAETPKDENADIDLSDNESELSEVDEADFADFDPTRVALEDRPLVDIDEDVARTLKAAKRKKTGDGEGKKAKEGKREKRKKRTRDEDEDPDGQQIEGKRIRKPKSVRIEGDRKERERAKERKAPTPENEEDLTPEERRRRALDRAMDAALKNPNKRRRKKDEVVSLCPSR